MKNIALIPARGGSKRLPQKNMMFLNGIPLIAHTILYAQNNSDIINDIYVSTDDDEIKSTAIKFGAKVIDRPAELSGEFEPTVSALKHALESINDIIDNVILLQATNPLRPEYLMRDCYEKFSNNLHDSLFTVSRDYHKLGKIENNLFLPYNYIIGQRSQDLAPLFYENGLLYISKANLILQDKIISGSAFPYITNDSFPIVDIDTLADFEYAEYLIKKSQP